MKKKIIIFLLVAVFAIPIAGFLFLVFFPQPLFISKVFKFCQIIDLRKNLPKGHFQKVSIVLQINKNYEEVLFEVPAGKIAEFEAGFRKYIQSATPLKETPCYLPGKLKIQTEKKDYSVKIHYSDNVVTIYGGFFHHGFWSRELRKVFYDAGLKYSKKQQTSEIESDSIRPLPEGRFQKVSIVSRGINYEKIIIFEVPADKMREFEDDFRRCFQSAIPIPKGTIDCSPVELIIQTEKEEYFAPICYNEDVAIYSDFGRGIRSRELRKVFYDAGLEYTSGGPKPPRKKDANEPNHLEILRQSGLKSMEYTRRMKEANEKQKEVNEPINKLL